MSNSAARQILAGLSCPFCGGSFSVVHLMEKPKRPPRAIVRCVVCGKIGIGTLGPQGEHQPVTSLDVEKVREFLLNFDGDFKALFKRRVMSDE